MLKYYQERKVVAVFGAIFSVAIIAFFLWQFLPPPKTGAQNKFQISFLISIILIEVIFLLIPSRLYPNFGNDSKYDKKEFIVPTKWLFIVVLTFTSATVYISGIIYFEPHAYENFLKEVDKIESIDIKPTSKNYQQLVAKEIHITNTEDIRKITNALKASQIIRPNHPQSMWKCSLLCNTKADFIKINLTYVGDKRNGLLIEFFSPNIGLRHTRRSDRMKTIIEDLVN